MFLLCGFLSRWIRFLFAAFFAAFLEELLKWFFHLLPVFRDLFAVSVRVMGVSAVLCGGKAFASVVLRDLIGMGFYFCVFAFLGGCPNVNVRVHAVNEFNLCNAMARFFHFV